MPNFKSLFCLLSFLIIFPCSYAIAEITAPVPPKKNEIKAIEKKLDEEKKQKSNLKIRLNKIKTELNSTKNDLIKLSKSIKEKEKSLKKLEKKSKQLELEKNSITSKIEKEYGSVADLVLALQRIRRIPPEALFLKPGSPLKTAQTSMLLESALPKIQKQVKTLSIDLERINSINLSLEKEKETIEIALKSLDQEYKSLNKIVDKRKGLFKSTQKDFDNKEAHIKKLAGEAKSLQDLITKLNQENDERTARISSSREISPLIPLPKRGVKQLPIMGSLKIKFGEKDHLGAKSRGLTIEGRPGSLVVAPMGGIVRFAGFFKHHGNIVIIEHESGYHSLVAELDKIDTLVGQTLVSGEPIGRIKGDKNNPPIIYYELRYKGKPINPSKKFSDLI